MASRMTEWRRANPEKARRQYERQYNDETKNKIISKNKTNNGKTLARRKAMLSEFKCHTCGNLDPYTIQWHHIDPSTKEFEIWRAAWAEEKFWDEVLKCVPMCANCHFKIHQNLLCLIPVPFPTKLNN